MRFDATFNPFSPGRFSDLSKWAEAFTTAIQKLLDTLPRVLNGQISFGDGATADNIKGEWKTVTSHATGGTEFAVTHTLGVVPVGFLLVVPPASGTVNKGTTSWTTTNLYLNCSANAQTITIFVLAPPETA